MPPKRKPGIKVTKQEEDKPESIILNAYPLQKIPKQPHFRYVGFICQSKAQHIRVKCWKVFSCKFPDLSDEFFDELDEFDELAEQNELQNSMRHPTIQKSFKHLKKIALNVSLLTKQRFLRKFCASWKLDSFEMTVTPQTRVHKLLKRLLNSKSRNCFWNHDCNSNRSNEPYQEVDIKAISLFRRLKGCTLFVNVWHGNKGCIRMQLNTEKLVSYSRPDQFIQKKLGQGDGSIYQGLVNTPLCYEKLSFKKIVGAPNLPLLSNLQDLRLSWDSSLADEGILDISFIKQYAGLKCLHIKIDSCQVKTLDFLIELPNLTEFYLSPVDRYRVDEGLFHDLPKLTRLEKFGLKLQYSKIFKMKNVRDFIMKNKNLKSLNLNLSIEDFDLIFKAKSFKLRPNLETLRIRFNEIEGADSETAKRIAQFLRKCNFVKKLDIHLKSYRSQIYPDLNEIFLISGLAKMKGLQELNLFYPDHEDHLLKSVLTSLANLSSLGLYCNFRFPSDAQNLGDIVGGLAKLQHLQKLQWHFITPSPTPAVENKLSNFLNSIRKLKNLQICLDGFDEEVESRLNDKFLPKLPLSPKTLIFQKNWPRY